MALPPVKLLLGANVGASGEVAFRSKLGPFVELDVRPGLDIGVPVDTGDGTKATVNPKLTI